MSSFDLLDFGGFLAEVSVSALSIWFSGGPGVQIRVCHLLPRRSAQDARQENMRGFPCDAVPLPRGPYRPPRDGHGRHDPD